MRLDIPNLDAMEPAELESWADSLTLQHPVKATRPLRMYARLKARAMRYRLSGLIMDAVANETECDAIYSRLPKSYRW